MLNRAPVIRGSVRADPGHGRRTLLATLEGIEAKRDAGQNEHTRPRRQQEQNDECLLHDEGSRMKPDREALRSSKPTVSVEKRTNHFSQFDVSAQ